MFSVMQRINEIKNRFGLKKSDQQQNMKNLDMNYDKFQEKAIANVKPAEGEGNGKNIDGIAGKSVSEINKIAEFYAGQNGISPSLVKAVIKTESGFNPNAVSRKGARGLMQLMPSVIKDSGVRNPFDPKENVNAGVGLLKNLLEEYDGDYKKALSAYNAGKRAVDRSGGVPEYKETREYVEKVIGSYLDTRDIEEN